MAYATQSQLETRYGRSNIQQWARMYGDEPAATVTSRISDALNWATEEIDSRLRGGPYTIPFAETYPAHIVRACVMIAAVELYNRKGTQDYTDDGQALNKLTGEREEALQMLREIRAGQIKLNVAELDEDVPEVISIETTKDEDNY